jgi:hypothetical protein
MDRIQSSEIAGSGVQASAEIAECNCPDGCQRDHDYD